MIIENAFIPKLFLTPILDGTTVEEQNKIDRDYWRQLNRLHKENDRKRRRSTK